jgi:hypothetical protein
MQPAYISKTLTAADVNIIAETQTPAGAGDITLDGTSVVGGVAVLDTQRQVLITQAADETGHTFTVYGTTDSGAPISEAVAGSAAASVKTTKSFKTVTRVAISAAATGAVQVGTNGIGETPWKVLDTFANPMNIGLAVIVTGTINYTVNYTYEDPNNPVASAGPLAWPLTALSAKTANEQGSITFPIAAVQLVVNSGTGSATLVVVQSGGDGP